MRGKLLDFFHWVDHEAPAWLNIILTAGFHSLFTLIVGRFGLSGHAAFAYGMKEAGPIVRAKLTGRPWPRPRSGWTKGWIIADSVADVAGPLIVHLFYVLG